VVGPHKTRLAQAEVEAPVVSGVALRHSRMFLRGDKACACAVSMLYANIASTANSGETLPQVAAMMSIAIAIVSRLGWLTGLRTRHVLGGTRVIVASWLFLFLSCCREPMTRDAALAARFSGLFSGPFVCRALFVSGPAASTCDLTLSVSIHRCKPTICFCHRVLLPLMLCAMTERGPHVELWPFPQRVEEQPICHEITAHGKRDARLPIVQSSYAA
jgi:hypothetical protein